MANIVSFFASYPGAATLATFLGAVMAHVLVGIVLHATRLHDFDWSKLPQFVEQDYASKRVVAVYVLALSNVMAQVTPSASAHALAQVFLAALVPAAAAATAPVVRDTISELVQLLTGTPVSPSSRH